MDLTITPEQERQWREQGFTVVDGFDVTQARADAVFDEKNTHDGFGSANGAFEVPCGVTSVDLIPFRLLRVAKQLLRSERLMLSQADVWIKKPNTRTKFSNDDQRMHCDFGNNCVCTPLTSHSHPHVRP